MRWLRALGRALCAGCGHWYRAEEELPGIPVGPFTFINIVDVCRFCKHRSAAGVTVEGPSGNRGSLVAKAGEP